MRILTHLPLTVFASLVVFALGAKATAPVQTRQVVVKSVEGTAPSFTEAPSSKIKSFREWKSEKVQEALSKVTTIKTQIELYKQKKSDGRDTRSKDPNLLRRKGVVEASVGMDSEQLEQQLNQDQSTLEMAKELSVTDYFVGYLTKLQDKSAAFNQVAGKLTAEEVAELMAAYANNVFGSHPPELAPSAADLNSERVK